ncbi:MAG: alpha-amylase [Rubrivivax sp.]|nr:alpha-amylase [Rubrivivax sp.]
MLLRHLFVPLAAALLLACAWPPATDMRPVPATHPPSALPEGWHHGVFMEIFVRGYQDGDGDGIGDLRGLISRLDYLKDLGVRGLWLMPVHASADHDHGYATVDYRAIEPAYGTQADFDELLKQAHARGIGVIVDYVINHASWQHPLFQDALRSSSSPWRDWFVWQPPGEPLAATWDIWGKFPWYDAATQPWTHTGEPKDLPRPAAGARDVYFGTFGPHMPDFNFRNPAVWAWHADNLRHGLERGLDGYRLDAVPHLVENGPVNWNDQPESRRLTKRMQDLITAYPNRWVVCEATAEPAAYASSEVCGASFAFAQARHYVDAALGNAESVQRVAEHFLTAPHTLATFVSNHDLFAGRRLWDQVGGDTVRYKLAAAGYLLQPGTPFVYYGEEVGQPQLPGLPGDQPLRGPMSWTPDAQRAGFTAGRPFRPVAPQVATNNAATQAADPQSIHAFYKAMIGLRNRHASIARGSYEAAHAQGLVATWQRRHGGDHTLTAIHYGTERAPVLVQLPAGARLVPLYPAGGGVLGAGPQGRLQIDLPPQSVHVWAVQP